MLFRSAVIHNAVLRTHKGVSHDAIEMGVKSLRYKRLAKKGGARAIIAKGSHAVEAGKYVAKHLGKGAVKAITKHIRHISTSPFAPAIAVVAAATALHLAGFTKNHK